MVTPNDHPRLARSMSRALDEPQAALADAVAKELAPQLDLVALLRLTLTNTKLPREQRPSWISLDARPLRSVDS